jgi:hypothetical protein
MVSLEQGLISENIAYGSSQGATYVKELRSLEQSKLKQSLTLRFLIDRLVISLLRPVTFKYVIINPVPRDITGLPCSWGI